MTAINGLPGRDAGCGSGLPSVADRWSLSTLVYERLVCVWVRGVDRWLRSAFYFSSSIPALPPLNSMLAPFDSTHAYTVVYTFSYANDDPSVAVD